MVEAREVSKSFGGVLAVRGASFELRAGEVTGLLGPNGAGKTTTIRMLTGWVPPDAGSISVAGFPLASHGREARRAIGYLPESAASYAEMRASEYLDFRARLYGLPRARRRARVGEVLDRCRVADVARRRIAHLSKGYRQRVALAASIVHDPRVVILDEPANALDPAQIREVRGLIRDLAPGRAVLVSSHILAEVEATCDRVIVMARGEVLARGTPRELAGVAVVVEFAPPGDAGVLDSLNPWRVERSPTPDGGVRATITPGAGESASRVRERVARAALDAGGAVRELRDEAAGLESVFLRLVSERGVAEPIDVRAGARP